MSRTNDNPGARPLRVPLAFMLTCAITLFALPASSSGSSCKAHVADMTIGLTAAGTQPYTVGEEVALTATVSNQAPCPAPEVEVSIALPPGVSSSGDGRWGPIDFGKSETKRFALTATIDAAGPHAVTATTTPSKFTDPDLANNSTSLTLTTVEPTTAAGPSGPKRGPDFTPGDETGPDPDTGTAPRALSPEEGNTIGAEKATGSVFVKEPGAKRRPIDPDGELLPPGTVVDTRSGTVSLTHDYNGKLEQMTFWAGKFRVEQKRSRKPVTTIKLVGKAGCVPAPGNARLLRKRGKQGRRLWGSGHKGHYRTQGRGGSATVRGTKWLTVDLCNGESRFKLRRGRLAIDDFSQTGKVNHVLRNKGTYVTGAATR